MLHRSIFKWTDDLYSDTWHIHTNDARALILFMPGNPGLLDYYEAFALQLQRLSSHTLDIYAISQLGHTLASPASAGIATLSQQVDSKLDFLKTLPQQKPVILIGHSIGAWMVTQVGCPLGSNGSGSQALPKQMLKTLPDAHGILLFPTISHIASTPNGKHLQPLFATSAVKLLPWLSSLLRFVPTQILLRLVYLATGHSDAACATTANFVSRPRVVEASLRMAAQEFERVKELDPLLPELAPRLTALWAQEGVDKWTPEEHIREFERAAPGRSYRTEEQLPHAFCCELEHSDYAAAKVFQFIDRIIGP